MTWRARLAREDGAGRGEVMRLANPAFIPRNHLVEEMIQAAVTREDFVPFTELLEVTSRPYVDQPGRERYSAAARPEQCVRATFCGT